VPAPVMRWLGYLVEPLVRMLMGSMQGKYPMPYDADVVRSKLEAIRQQLQKQDWKYILGQFSFAGAWRALGGGGSHASHDLVEQWSGCAADSPGNDI
jgi:hypothetical protein